MWRKLFNSEEEEEEEEQTIRKPYSDLTVKAEVEEEESEKKKVNILVQ